VLRRTTIVYGVSIAVHAALAASVVFIPRQKGARAVAIALTDVKEKEKKKPEPPKPPPPPPKPATITPREPRAPAAPAPKPAAEPAPAPSPAATPPPSSQASGFQDLGLTLSGGNGPGGVHVPQGAKKAAPVEKKTEHKIKALTPSADSCSEEASKPKRLKAVSPVYPAAARAAQIEGVVKFEATIDEEGRVTSVRILEGLGHGLDEATIEAIQQWAFEPALRCGKPTRTTIKSKVTFSLT
jgi:protein TonB